MAMLWVYYAGFYGFDACWKIYIPKFQFRLDREAKFELARNYVAFSVINVLFFSIYMLFVKNQNL